MDVIFRQKKPAGQGGEDRDGVYGKENRVLLFTQVTAHRLQRITLLHL